MSPVSPVFQTVEAVSIVLKFNQSNIVQGDTQRYNDILLPKNN